MDSRVRHTVVKLWGFSGSFIFHDMTFFSSVGGRTGGVDLGFESDVLLLLSISLSLFSMISSSSIWLSAASCLYLDCASWLLIVWTKSWKWLSWLNPRSWPMYLESVKGVNILIHGYSRASSRCGGGLLPASDFLSQEDILKILLWRLSTTEAYWSNGLLTVHNKQNSVLWTKQRIESIRREGIGTSLWRVGSVR